MSDDKLWIEDIIPTTAIGDADSLETLSDIIKDIQISVDRGMWKDVTVAMSDGNYVNGKWIEHEGIYFIGWRKETDKEYNKRIKQVNANKKRSENAEKLKQERERKQYERLKKKFENNNNGEQ